MVISLLSFFLLTGLVVNPSLAVTPSLDATSASGEQNGDNSGCCSISVAKIFPCGKLEWIQVGGERLAFVRYDSYKDEEWLVVVE